MPSNGNRSTADVGPSPRADWPKSHRKMEEDFEKKKSRKSVGRHEAQENL